MAVQNHAVRDPGRLPFAEKNMSACRATDREKFFILKKARLRCVRKTGKVGVDVYGFSKNFSKWAQYILLH
jgi:hypothetical protein